MLGEILYINTVLTSFPTSPLPFPSHLSSPLFPLKFMISLPLIKIFTHHQHHNKSNVEFL